MELDTMVITAFITLMGGGLGTVFWSRLNRIEGRLDGIIEKMSSMATHHDLERLATHYDIQQLHEELVHLRAEQAVMRSDLTHVALAVGARPGKASQA